MPTAGPQSAAPLVPAELEAALAGSIFAGKLHYFDYIHSTNSTAMQAAAAGEEEGAVFFAERQVQGRGRGGHSWHSEPYTGIYVSVVLRPQMPALDALWLSLMTGLAAYDAISQMAAQMKLPITPDLRWPNDILLGEKKMGGILAELALEGDRVKSAVVGVGLNVNQSTFPEELTALATSLRIETGREWPRQALAAALLQSVGREYQPLARGVSAEAAQSLVRRFEQRSSFARGAHVHVEEDGGYQGVSEGLDGRGFLLVRSDGRLRKVLSGGVRKV